MNNGPGSESPPAAPPAARPPRDTGSPGPDRPAALQCPDCAPARSAQPLTAAVGFLPRRAIRSTTQRPTEAAPPGTALAHRPFQDGCAALRRPAPPHAFPKWLPEGAGGPCPLPRWPQRPRDVISCGGRRQRGTRPTGRGAAMETRGGRARAEAARDGAGRGPAAELRPGPGGGGTPGVPGAPRRTSAGRRARPEGERRGGGGGTEPRSRPGRAGGAGYGAARAGGAGGPGGTAAPGHRG